MVPGIPRAGRFETSGVLAATSRTRPGRPARSGRVPAHGPPGPEGGAQSRPTGVMGAGVQAGEAPWLTLDDAAATDGWLGGNASEAGQHGHGNPTRHRPTGTVQHGAVKMGSRPSSSRPGEDSHYLVVNREDGDRIPAGPGTMAAREPFMGRWL